jgi:two-component system catabolic regulation response regulator CreB
MSGEKSYRIYPSLDDDDYRFENMASFIACKEYDENISVITKSKEQILCREAQPANCKSRKRILVVDDEFDTSLTIKVVLETYNFEGDSFTDPQTALRNFIAGLYDLAIIDMRMPIINGFALYDEIKKLDNNLKICFLTAAEDTYYETFRKHAFPKYDENCIIRKPVENELLIKQINSIIG